MGGTPILNQCLDEAVRLCQELTQWSAETEGEAGSVLEHAKDVDALLAGEDADGLHDAYVEAVATIGRIRKGLEDQADTTSESLEALAGRARYATTTLDRLLASVRDHAAHLAELRGRILAEFDADLGRSGTAFEQLAQAVEAYRAGLETALDRAAGDLAHLRDQVTSTEERIERSLGELTPELGSLATEAFGVTRGVTGGSAMVSSTLGREVVQFCHNAINRHNLAVLALRRGFTEDSSSGEPSATWMSQFLAPAWEAGEALDDARSEAEHTVTAATETLSEALGSAAQSCDATTEGVGRVMPPLLP